MISFSAARTRHAYDRTRFPALAACLVTLACASEPAVEDTWYTVSSNAGDTTVVRTVGAITRTADIRVDETLTIGKTDGADAEMFGRIRYILPARDGGVYIVEQSPHRIQKFDSVGAFQRAYGAPGRGPGEYRIAGAIAEDSSGSLLHWPPSATHVAVYDSTGRFVRQIAHGRTGVPLAGYAGHGGTVVTEWLTSEMDSGGRVREVRKLIMRDSSGVPVDSLTSPAPFGERVMVRYSGVDGSATYTVPLSPTFQLASRTDGSWVYGSPELYVIHVYSRGISRLRIESDLPATPSRADERGDLAENATLELRSEDATAAVQAGDIPEQKPFFKRLLTDSDGRIWVQLHQPATRVSVKRCPPSRMLSGGAATAGCPDGRDSVRMNEWVEPTVFDVYAATGELLGRLTLPERTEWKAARGNHLWLVRRDDSDVQQVVRYRMTFAEGAR